MFLLMKWCVGTFFVIWARNAPKDISSSWKNLYSNLFFQSFMQIYDRGTRDETLRIVNKFDLQSSKCIIFWLCLTIAIHFVSCYISIYIINKCNVIHFGARWPKQILFPYPMTVLVHWRKLIFVENNVSLFKMILLIVTLERSRVFLENSDFYWSSHMFG